VLLPGNGKLDWFTQSGQGKNGVGVGVGDNPGVGVIVGVIVGVTVFVGVFVGVTVFVGVVLGVGGNCIESGHISTMVPASPPGPVIVNVVNEVGFDMVNVPPP
jgi:hypothetical protein